MNVNIAWKKLQSSAILAVAYQGTSLFIRFVTKSEYEYFNVPKTIYEELITAPSIGKYFNARIKEDYRYRRIF